MRRSREDCTTLVFLFIFAITIVTASIAFNGTETNYQCYIDSVTAESYPCGYMRNNTCYDFNVYFSIGDTHFYHQTIICSSHKCESLVPSQGETLSCYWSDSSDSSSEIVFHAFNNSPYITTIWVAIGVFCSTVVAWILFCCYCCRRRIVRNNENIPLV